MNYSRQHDVRGGVAVNTGGSAGGARSAEGQASVSTGGSAVSARSAEEVASVSTGGCAVDARSAEAAVSVSTGGNAMDARSAWRMWHLPRRHSFCFDHDVSLADLAVSNLSSPA